MPPGTIVGTDGGVLGSHTIDSLSYEVTNAFEGDLILESSTLAEPLHLRLYFDAHNLDVINSGRPLLNRFHRMALREREFPLGTFEILVRLEYGIWQQTL